MLTGAVRLEQKYSDFIMPTTDVGLDSRGLGTSYVDYWMECDDLKNCICKYSNSRPAIPASQVHIVMWEKQSSDSGYRLPCERESFKKAGRVQHTAAAYALSNSFPSPVMTSLPTVSAGPTRFHVPAMTSLPAAAVLRSSSAGQNGAAISTSVQHIPLKEQDENSSKLSRKMADSTRLQRMKQKFELDRKRSSSLSSSKPVIPRIPVGISAVSEPPNRKSVLSLPGKMDFPCGRCSPSKIIGCISSQKVSRASVQNVAHENNAAKSNVRAGRHSIAALQTRSLLKVGRQSYLDAILPLIKGNKPSTSSVQKFEAYVPKSQKVSLCGVNEAATSSVTEQGNAGLDTKTRKPRVCFSESNSLDVKQLQLSEKFTNGLSLNQMPTKAGILTKHSALPKSTSQLALAEPKFGFDDADLDFSNFMDLDKILFEGNNSGVAVNPLNITSEVFPMLQSISGDASDSISATVGCGASGSISTSRNSFDVLSVVQENTSDFESKVFEETLGGAVCSSLPNLDNFIPTENWTASQSGFSDRNINSDCTDSNVMNSLSSIDTLGDYLNGNTNGVYDFSSIGDNGVTDIPSALHMITSFAEDFSNLPLPLQSFTFGEEDWAWFS